MNRAELLQPAGSGPSPAPEFRDARRIQESLLAAVESRCLKWLAVRLSPAVTSDHLTLLGLASMLMGGVFYALGRWWAPALLVVNFWIAANWFGDSLDGTVARIRNRQRPRYGFYVDHIIDSVGSLFLITGLAVSGYCSERVAVAMLVCFLLFSINTYLATHVLGSFRLSFARFGPTELRILLIAGNITCYARPVVHLFGRQYLFFDAAGTIGSILMAVVLVWSIVSNTVTLYRLERV